jgi:deazaflavin-dependent oxidoreductase (nitroreductase family)
MSIAQEDVQTALARNQLVDITTTGRRTGKPRRLEIAMHNIGGRLYISGMPSPRRRSWLANLAADPRLTLHLKQGTRADLPATARVIDDEEERRAVLTAVARNWRRDDVETMVRQSPLIEVEVGGRAGDGAGPVPPGLNGE